MNLHSIPQFTEASLKDCLLQHKENLKQYIKIGMTSCVLSDSNETKLFIKRIKNKIIFGNYMNSQRLNNTLVNNE